MSDSSILASQAELVLKPRLMDQVRDSLRRRHYSLRTEKVNLGWIRRFILFHNKRHPAEMGPEEVNAFLSHLARHDRVAASTQNQALSALLFLYRHILGSPLPWLDGLEHAKRPARLPTVLTESEVKSVLAALDGTRGLMAALLYGAGLRLLEDDSAAPSTQNSESMRCNRCFFEHPLQTLDWPRRSSVCHA